MPRSYATWDVLLPSREQAAKLASSHITTKFFQLQQEYLGTHRIRVTVCNVPAFITGEVLAAFLSVFGRVEEINLLRSAAGTAYGDYVFRLCLTREGFQAIPEIIVSRERRMMVVVEGRRPRCWGYKQLGHITKFCPRKAQQNAAATTDTTVTTATISSEQLTKATASKEPGPVQSKVAKQPNTDEGWTEVSRKKRKSPNKGEKKPVSAYPVKDLGPKAVSTTEPAPVTSTAPSSSPDPVNPPASATPPASPLETPSVIT